MLLRLVVMGLSAGIGIVALVVCVVAILGAGWIAVALPVLVVMGVVGAVTAGRRWLRGVPPRPGPGAGP